MDIPHEVMNPDDLQRYDTGPRFTPQELSEIQIFRKQGSFINAKKARLKAHKRRMLVLEEEFERRMLDLQEEFDCSESRFETNIISPFLLSLRKKGAKETRKRTIPAYTFDRFPDLPRELQLMIWQKAIVPPRGGKIRMLMSMTEEYSYMSEEKQKVHNPTQTTSVLRPRYTGSSAIFDKGPVLLVQVCSDARMAYRNVYARLACREGGYRHVDHHFYDTRDEFYMGEKDFADFKILIDVLILQHTTRPLGWKLMEDIVALQRIRNLTVDLNIFGGAPADIWMNFPKLEVLTIAFYPFATIQDGDKSFMEQDDLESYQNNEGFDRNLVFVKPRRNQKFIKRADAISTLATKSLRAVAKENPAWKMPRLEVVVRKCGDKDLDYPAEIYANDEEEIERFLAEGGLVDIQDQNTAAISVEALSSSSPPPAQELAETETEEEYEDEDENQDQGEGQDEEDDSTYLLQLPSRISHPPITTEQIKRWKQRYHPSREKSPLDPLGLMVSNNRRRMRGESERRSTQHRYYADSEGGTDDERPFQTHDPVEDEYW